LQGKCGMEIVTTEHDFDTCGAEIVSIRWLDGTEMAHIGTLVMKFIFAGNDAVTYGYADKRLLNIQPLDNESIEVDALPTALIRGLKDSAILFLQNEGLI